MGIKVKYIFIFAVLLASDQIAKYILPVLVCNKNLAWNIPISAGFFYFSWIVIMAVLIYSFYKSDNRHLKLFFILIFSGAISNFIDRIRFGCVIDNIDLKAGPVFNLGDLYISLGVAALIFYLSFIKIKK